MAHEKCDLGGGHNSSPAYRFRNIYQATLISMKRALIQLLSTTPKLPSIILVDAMPVTLEHMDIPIVHFIYGEKMSTSIAAASIIAKVTRDRLMARMDPVLPGYAFVSNKNTVRRITGKALRSRGSPFCIV